MQNEQTFCEANGRCLMSASTQVSIPCHGLEQTICTTEKLWSEDACRGNNLCPP